LTLAHDGSGQGAALVAATANLSAARHPSAANHGSPSASRDEHLVHDYMQ